MSRDPADSPERPLSDLTDDELHQEGLRGLRERLALDPTNANINPADVQPLRDANRARLDAIAEEQRRRRQAPSQQED